MLDHPLKSQRVIGHIGALLCLALLLGCQQDEQTSEWGDFEPDPDAHIPRDTDTSDTFPDADTSDMSLDADTADISPDTRPPDVETFFPDEKPSDTVCANGWCWVHPRPMAHTVLELEGVGDKVYGVARLDPTRGMQRPGQQLFGCAGQLAV